MAFAKVSDHSSFLKVLDGESYENPTTSVRDETGLATCLSLCCSRQRRKTLEKFLGLGNASHNPLVKKPAIKSRSRPHNIDIDRTKQHSSLRPTKRLPGCHGFHGFPTNDSRL